MISSAALAFALLTGSENTATVPLPVEATTQERTTTSAVQFLSQFFTQERPPARMSDGGLATKPSTYEYSLVAPAERVVSAAVWSPAGDNSACTTVITFEDGWSTRVLWAGSTVSMVTFGEPRYSSMALGRTLIEVTENGSSTSFIFWPGSEQQARRLHQAMEFLRTNCDPMRATGF